MPEAVSMAASVVTLSFTLLNSSPSCSPGLFRSRVHLILGLKTTVIPKKEPSVCLNPYSQQHSHLFLLIGCSLTLYFQELTPVPMFQKDQGAPPHSRQTDSRGAGKPASPRVGGNLLPPPLAKPSHFGWMLVGFTTTLPDSRLPLSGSSCLIRAYIFSRLMQ